MDNAVASASKLAHRSGASMTPSSETRVDSISLRIVVLFLRYSGELVSTSGPAGRRAPEGWRRASLPRAEAGGDEQVGVAVVAGAGDNVDDRGAHLLGGERRAEAVEEGGDRGGACRGVGLRPPGRWRQRRRGEGAAELCVQFLKPGTVAGDRDDVRAVLGDGDGASESPAGAGDKCRRSGQFLRWHAGLPCCEGRLG